METMIGLESFVRSAEAGSFSEAARRLGMSSAAVGKNVARLEADLGVRLFQRSTRSLTLTEAGRRFLQEVGGGLATIRSAVANLAGTEGQPAGTLKVSMGNGFGRTYMVPMLAPFLARYPAIAPDWHFDNRQVDLIGEGFDAAIGGGIELPPGLVARELAPAHRVLVASPGYLDGKPRLAAPADLAQCDGIYIRSPQTGRIRALPLRKHGDRANRQVPATMKVRMTMTDPEAACESAQQGLGIAFVSLPNALPYLQSGALQRVLPDWYADGGTLSIYFAAQKLLPAKTRVFVDYVVEHFRMHKLAQAFSAF